MIKINENEEYVISFNGQVFCEGTMMFDVPTDFLKAFYDLLRPYPNNKHSVSVVVVEDDERGPVFVFVDYPTNQCSYVINSQDYKNITKIDITHEALARMLVNDIEGQYDLFLKQYSREDARQEFILCLNNLKAILN